MTRATLATVLVAALVVLAGCAGSPVGPTTAGPGETTDGGDGEAGTDDGTSGSESAGTVSFYLSDEPNAIGDFEHLNVTVTSVGFHKTGGDDESDDEDDDSDEEDSEDDDPTNGTETTTVANATTTVENTTTVGANETAGNGTSTTVVSTTEDGDEPEEVDGDEEESDDGEEADDDGDGDDDSGNGDWVTYQVPNVTVDLTQLLGANATRLAEFGVPAGSYDAVFVHVSGIEATLENGEQVRVKLPSQKLKLNRGFEVGPNASVDFVYDIAVHEAGNSGKYILKPVISESGTDVPIESVDEEDGDDEEHEDDEDDEPKGDDHERALDATFVGNVTPGEDATVSVTENDSAVAGAELVVDDETVARTGADGTATVAVPEDDEFEITVRKGDAETELEVEFEGDGEDEHEGNEGEDGDEGDDAEDGDEQDLSASFVGNVTRGGTATVAVTANGSAVADATVEVNGRVVGETADDGRLTFEVPNTKELAVKVTAGDAEVELEVEFGKNGAGKDDAGKDGGSGG